MAELTLKDVKNYILVIQTNFENAYKFETKTEYNTLYASWLNILGKYPKEVCDAAVYNALSKAKFAPRIGDIVEEIKALLSADQKTEEELWAELLDVKYDVYEQSRYLPYPQHYDEAYKKLEKIYAGLSDELKHYLVNVSALISFSKLDEESLPYEKNTFLKRIPVIRKHAEDKALATEFLKLADAHGIKLLNDK